jgi:hypothetical protein
MAIPYFATEITELLEKILDISVASYRLSLLKSG